MPVLLALLLSLQAHAGVRVVDRGGGFGELQAYAIDKRIPELTRICVDKRATCNLSAQDLEVVNQLVANADSILNSLIKINSTCEVPFFHQENGEFSVDACELYQDSESEFGPNPKSLFEIGKIVLRIRISILKKDLADAAQANRIADVLMRDLDFTENPNAFQENGVFYRLNIWSMKVGPRPESFLSLETKSSSTDLTSSLENSLGCPQKPRWSLDTIQIDALSRTESEVQGNLAWQCGSARFRAFLSLKVVFQNGTLDHTDISVVSKEAL